MHKTKYFLILSCFIFFLPSQIQSQTASITEGCSPLEIDFFAPAGSSTYFWDFQDNATSTLENPSNTFIDPGTFVVEFSESVNGPIIGTVTITVFATPILAISYTPDSGCAPLDVAFQSTSTINPGIIVNNYVWVFGDGGTTNNTDAPAHTYNSAGIFTASLDIETNYASCNVTEIFPDIISVSTIEDIGFTTNPSPPTSCVSPFLVSFNNTTPNPQNLTFEWNFGNGSTFSGQSPEAQTYTEGAYTVTLNVSDAFGCSGSFSQVVSVGTPLANFILSDTICIDVEYDMQNISAAGSYFWNFGPNAFPPTSLLANPQNVSFTTAGFHNIFLSVTAPDGCVGDTTISIYVDEVDPTYTANPIYTCEGSLIVNFDPNSNEAVSWFWNFSGGSFSTDENPTHEFFSGNNGIYDINNQEILTTELFATNPSGCTASFEDAIIIHRPNALFMPDVINGCAPLTVEFADSSTSNEPLVLWEWDYGDGQTNTFNNDDSHEHTFTNPGAYDVQLIVTNEAGCIDTSYLLTIEVGDQITPSFEVDQTEVCPGDSVHFTNLTPLENIDAFHYTTDNGLSFHCHGEPDMTWAFVENTGPMDVTLTVEYNGCYSSFTQDDLITVKGPIAELDYLVDCANPFDISFINNSMDANVITWDFGDTTSSNISNLNHTYDTTGVYWVYLTAENTTSGCAISVDSTQIYVTDIQAFFELDSILCAGTAYNIDASSSIDVEASCWRGYSWYFPFNRPITSQDSFLSMTFPSGDQSVTLVTRDINGCKDTASLDVSVFSTAPAFEADNYLICIPDEISFTDLSVSDTTILSWDWNFGDGEISTEQNPIHLYDAPLGTNPFPVTLTTTDAVGCSFFTTQFIQFYQPISTISSNPLPNLCEGEEISFTATDFTQGGSNLTFSWDFANGFTDTGMSTSTIFENEGTYEVVLSYEEIASGCQDTSTVIIQVQTSPEAAFTSDIDGIDIICYPQNALFTDNSISSVPLSYQWNFGNGQMATAMDPAASFGKGIFEVQLIASTPFGCSDTTYQTYTLVGPEGDFTLDPNMICLGDFVNFNLIDTIDVSSFSWDFGDGLVVDDINPTSHQYNFNPPSGQTVATLILRSANDACTIPIEKPIFIHQVIADFIVNDGLDTTACVGESISFMNNSTGEDSYSWDFENGNISTTENPDFIFTEAGEYEVSLTIESDVLGCVNDITKAVTVFPLPNTEAIGDTICQDDDASLSIINSSGGSTYVWSPDDLISINNTDTPTTETLNNNTTFTVEETDTNGCVNSAEANVEVIDVFPSVDTDLRVCQGEDQILEITGNELYHFEWNPSIENCSNCSNPVIQNLQDNITYTVTVTDALGFACAESISTFNIEVIKGDVEIPNAFTPNNDQVNDYFNVVISSDYTPEDLIQEFKIWNRWGQLVYDNDNPSLGWDGKQNGKLAPSDAYVYLIKVSLFDCSVTEKSGDVTLIR